MTNQQQHPIAPPPALVQQWYNQSDKLNEPFITYIATRAAQWGADQELEACCEWLNRVGHFVVGGELRAARRPKPPSLKEQALAILNDAHRGDLGDNEIAILRCALESINE